MRGVKGVALAAFWQDFCYGKPVMVGLPRKPLVALAVCGIVLLLCGTLCLFDADGAGVDLCLVVLAVASAALVTLVLEPAGPPVPVLAGAAYLTPTEIRSPPPRR